MENERKRKMETSSEKNAPIKKSSFDNTPTASKPANEQENSNLVFQKSIKKMPGTNNIAVVPSSVSNGLQSNQKYENNRILQVSKFQNQNLTQNSCAKSVVEKPFQIKYSGLFKHKLREGLQVYFDPVTNESKLSKQVTMAKFF